MFARASAIWAALLVVAVLNGAFREAVLSPRMGAATAHVVSTAMLSAAIFVLARVSIGWIAPREPRDALAVGAAWLAMVLAFEFLAGHYAFGKTWRELFADYDVSRGRVWIVVLASTLLAPLWAFRQHHRR
jgi:cytochrome bd-type quinol oxidase subunit 1